MGDTSSRLFFATLLTLVIVLGVIGLIMSKPTRQAAEAMEKHQDRTTRALDQARQVQQLKGQGQ